jgi:hypothetical protein
MVPVFFPLYSPPKASALSSITKRPYLFAKAMIASMSQTLPYRCTGMTALVRFVTSFSADATLMQWSSMFTSAKRGMAPACTTEKLVAMKL